MIRTAILLLAVLCLAACCQSPTAPEVVKVPVRCDQKEPTKPAFSADDISKGTPIYPQVTALLADRKQREAYEVELRAALKACIDVQTDVQSRL